MPRPAHQASAGLTRVELLVVIMTVGLLLAVGLPVLGASAGRSRLTLCGNNLRQITRAAQEWASRHEERFPWNVLPGEGGTSNQNNDSPLSVNPFFHFSVLSNELRTPRLLVCPSDPVKKVAKEFSANADGLNHITYQNAALSYFVGTDAIPARPKTLLTGDRNIHISRARMSSFGWPVSSIDGNDPDIGFTNGLHRFYGNIGLADGSVETGDNALFRKLAQTSGDGVDFGAVGGPAPNNSVMIPGLPNPAVE